MKLLSEMIGRTDFQILETRPRKQVCLNTSYSIFASNVRSDPDLFPASNLVSFVERLYFDLAIVDLTDFFSVFCAELQRDELKQVVNRAYELLAEPTLSGREDFLSKYRETTDSWLES